MQWENTQYLYLLWLVVALILFFRWAGKKRKRDMASFADPNLLPSLAPDVSPRRRRVKSTLFLASLTLMIAALAQPEWGFHWQRVTREGIDIVIAIDTSKSMLATDVKPDRLERAKMAVKDLIDVAQGDRMSLVAFAGRSYTVCPPTLDYGAVAMFLKAIKVGIVPLGGTDIGGAVEQAVRIFKGDERNYRALVILSDGEDHGERLEKAAEEARELGVKIFSVGIGSKSGELIPVQGEGGAKAYLKDEEGKMVQTRLNENTLQELALMTGGAYVYPGGGQLGLADLYRDKIAAMEKKELVEKQKKVYENRFQWPLAVALFLLFAEMLVRERKRNF